MLIKKFFKYVKNCRVCVLKTFTNRKIVVLFDCYIVEKRAKNFSQRRKNLASLRFKLCKKTKGGTNGLYELIRLFSAANTII